MEDVFRAAAHDTECPELVKEGKTFHFNGGNFLSFQRQLVCKAVQKTVRSSSWTQSLKNIPTAGLVKSIRYSAAKLVKMYASLQRNK